MSWFLIAWPPVAFLLVLGAATTAAVRGGARSAEAASEAVTARTSVWLAVTLALVGLTLAALVAESGAVRDGLMDAVRAGSWRRATAVGALSGAAVAGVYFGGLDRLVARAQVRFGDYVPAGSTSVLDGGGLAFWVANVGLAPVVEELWYRGVLFDALVPLGPVGAAVVGCAAFGLFHWPGGAWYVVVTGVLVGGTCWGLRAWDGGLAGPVAAHLALNLTETVVRTRRARRAP